MKKTITKSLLLCLLLITFLIQPLTGCGKASDAADVPESSRKASNTSQDVDVDLTTLSSTMVYAEVYNMTVSEPEDYIGKTIRLSGNYYSAYYDQTDTTYHFVLIEDAAACCRQGLEFVLGDDYVFPDDYPADLTEVEITGTYSRYEELGQTYYYVVAETFRIL